MSIPHLARDEGGKYFVVHDKPFLPLGGELHNSSASDLRYMEEIVWPALRGIGGNFYLLPAYWECVEPEEGRFDFALVDGVIRQARREGVKLGLLWFGTWKNGASDYLPQWLKADRERCFLARDEKGAPLNVVSPLCAKARDLDARAFAALMAHLREFDGEENTVISVQVENEVGVWWHDRDFCPQASAAFEGEIPAEVASLFGVSGTWAQAFGKDACQQFMAYHYARYIEAVASAGRREYALPLFVNCVPFGTALRPAGGPDISLHRMWMRFAPSIDIFSPDIYSPNYKEICTAFAHDGNPLFIPETNTGKDSASKLIYAMGACNCIGFSPFGCEDFFNADGRIPDIDWASNGFSNNYVPGAGDHLRTAYALVLALWPDIRAAHAEGRVHACYQQSAPTDMLCIQNYRVTVAYGTAGKDPSRWLPPSPDEPLGACMIIERGAGDFLILGVNCFLTFAPQIGGTETVFVLDKRELLPEGGALREGRSLNGDERNVTGFGPTPAVLALQLGRYK